MSEQHIPGAVVGIACGGGPDVIRAYGERDIAAHEPVVPETPFEIGSISKQFTAVAILRLAREGKLSLDDRLARYVPAYTLGANVTIRELLQQTSGIPDTQDFSRDSGPSPLDAFGALLKTLAREPLVFAPGSAWGYSNSNYVLLARIVEIVTGRPFDAYITATILAPDGLAHTGFMGDATLIGLATGYHDLSTPTVAPLMDPAKVRGAGGIVSTAGDLLRWTRTLSTIEVPATDYAAMTTVPRFADGTMPAYGMGLAIDKVSGRRRIWHDGQTFGQSAFAAHYPDDGLDLVILANQSDADLHVLAQDVENAVFRSEEPRATQAIDDPYTIYFAAIDRMHALPVPAFIQYDQVFHAQHKTRSMSAAYRSIERVSDQMVRYEGLRPDGSRSGDVKVYHDHISVTAFLGSPEKLKASSQSIEPGVDAPADESAGTDPALKVIGSVRVSHYTIVRSADEDANGCKSSYHLLLTPKSDPSKYNLRELWIDRNAMTVCRAKLNARVLIIAPTNVDVIENIDTMGYVQNWSLHGTGHTFLGPYTADVSEQITDLRTDIAPLDPKLFQP